MSEGRGGRCEHSRLYECCQADTDCDDVNPATIGRCDIALTDYPGAKFCSFVHENDVVCDPDCAPKACNYDTRTCIAASRCERAFPFATCTNFTGAAFQSGTSAELACRRRRL